MAPRPQRAGHRPLDADLTDDREFAHQRPRRLVRLAAVERFLRPDRVELQRRLGPLRLRVLPPADHRVRLRLRTVLPQPARAPARPLRAMIAPRSKADYQPSPGA